MRISGDRWLYAGFAGCGLFALVASNSFGPGFGPGASLVPRVFGIVCLLVGAVGAVFPGRRPPAEPVAARDALWIALAFLAYGALFAYLGFLWDGLALVAILTVAFLPRRRMLPALVLEMLFVVGLYLIFTHVFQVQFPQGTL